MSFDKGIFRYVCIEKEEEIESASNLAGDGIVGESWNDEYLRKLGTLVREQGREFGMMVSIGYSNAVLQLAGVDSDFVIVSDLSGSLTVVELIERLPSIEKAIGERFKAFLGYYMPSLPSLAHHSLLHDRGWARFWGWGKSYIDALEWIGERGYSAVTTENPPFNKLFVLNHVVEQLERLSKKYAILVG